MVSKKKSRSSFVIGLEGAEVEAYEGHLSDSGSRIMEKIKIPATAKNVNILFGISRRTCEEKRNRKIREYRVRDNYEAIVNGSQSTVEIAIAKVGSGKPYTANGNQRSNALKRILDNGLLDSIDMEITVKCFVCKTEDDLKKLANVFDRQKYANTKTDTMEVAFPDYADDPELIALLGRIVPDVARIDENYEGRPKFIPSGSVKEMDFILEIRTKYENEIEWLTQNFPWKVNGLKTSIWRGGVGTAVIHTYFIFGEEVFLNVWGRYGSMSFPTSAKWSALKILHSDLLSGDVGSERNRVGRFWELEGLYNRACFCLMKAIPEIIGPKVEGNGGVIVTADETFRPGQNFYSLVHGVVGRKKWRNRFPDECFGNGEDADVVSGAVKNVFQTNDEPMQTAEVVAQVKLVMKGEKLKIKGGRKMLDKAVRKAIQRFRKEYEIIRKLPDGSHVVVG